MILLVFMVGMVKGQVNLPGIPYQAVVRNVDGTPMINTSIEMRFSIRNGDALNGVVVYQDNQVVTTNTMGLMSAVIGEGNVLSGEFAQIDWSIMPKFLQVEFKGPNNADYIEMGNQQLMSVPYALHSKDVKVKVSGTGDTLTIGNNSVIVPGLSLANSISNQFNGSILLAGVETCDSANVSVTGCNGQLSLNYNGTSYPLVEINGQCWFGSNLNTTMFNDGEVIQSGLFNSTWASTGGAAYADYNNQISNTYGRLYNGLAVLEEGRLCPQGWHVPSDCDWMFLEKSLGMSVIDLDTNVFSSNYSRGDLNNVGGKLRSTSGWNVFNGISNTNESGFGALPSGFRDSGGTFGNQGINGYWWTSSRIANNLLWARRINAFDKGVNRGAFDYYQAGFSVRCLKD
jgi:uncharacterized protein (TIGR02145 family)